MKASEVAEAVNVVVSKHSIKVSIATILIFFFLKLWIFICLIILYFFFKKRTTLDTRTGEQEFFPGTCLMESKNEASVQRH